MMSYEQIAADGRRAARRAHAEGKEPMTFSGLGHDAIRARIRQIPYIGRARLKGWKRVDAPAPRLMGCAQGYLFVDASGGGLTSEPALTVQEFVDYVYKHSDVGYAIVEAGQFQVVIATFEKK